MNTFDNYIKSVFQHSIQVCAICIKLTNRYAIRPKNALMNGKYLHILGKSLSQVGVLHENARISRIFRRKLISVRSMLSGNIKYHLHSCQPRVIVASCFVYKVTMDLSSIDHVCINPYTSDLSISVSSSGVYKLIFT